MFPLGIKEDLRMLRFFGSILGVLSKKKLFFSSFPIGKSGNMGLRNLRQVHTFYRFVSIRAALGSIWRWKVMIPKRNSEGKWAMESSETKSERDEIQLNVMWKSHISRGQSSLHRLLHSSLRSALLSWGAVGAQLLAQLAVEMAELWALSSPSIERKGAPPKRALNEGVGRPVHATLQRASSFGQSAAVMISNY